MYRVKEKFHVNEVMTYQTVWQRIVTVLQYEHSYHIWANERVLVQRSSRLCAWMESVSNTPTSNYIFLLMTNLMHLFMYLFISSLYMFWASQCSSSGDRIVLIHHLVWLVCVSDCLVCRSGGKWVPSGLAYQVWGIEALSFNHCCSGKSVLLILSVCLCVCVCSFSYQ